MNQLAAAVLSVIALTPASDPTRPGTATFAPVVFYGELLPPPVVHELMQQTLMHSRYHQPLIEPAIDLVPNDVWIVKVCNMELQCAETSLGFYVPGTNVVHIRDGMPGRPPSGIAVHELTHWLQWHSGWLFSSNCADITAHEAEAYAVEYMRDSWAGVSRPLEIPDMYRECKANERRMR